MPCLRSTIGYLHHIEGETTEFGNAEGGGINNIEMISGHRLLSWGYTTEFWFWDGEMEDVYTTYIFSIVYWHSDCFPVNIYWMTEWNQFMPLNHWTYAMHLHFL